MRENTFPPAVTTFPPAVELSLIGHSLPHIKKVITFLHENFPQKIKENDIRHRRKRLIQNLGQLSTILPLGRKTLVSLGFGKSIFRPMTVIAILQPGVP